MEKRYKEITIRIVTGLRGLRKPIAEQTIFLTDKEDIKRQIITFLKNNQFNLKKRSNKLIYIPEIDFLGRVPLDTLAEEITRRLRWIYGTRRLY